MKTDVIEIFQSIRSVLQPYDAVGFETSINSANAYELYTTKEILINNKKQKVYFCGVKICNGNVEFYLKPIFLNPEIKNILHPDLMKLLKENSLFYVNMLDEQLLNHISQALNVGFTYYKQQEWV
jgi:hypothetical protein